VDTVLVQYAGIPEFVTHTDSSNGGSTWTFQWVPPATGAPAAVTIYAAGNAANGNGDPTGDYIYTTSATLDRVNVAAEAGPEAAAVRLGPIAPNPVRGTATAALTLDRPARVRARLLDVQGRTVRTVAEGERAAGASSLRVETAGLAAGAYVLEVEAAGTRVVRSLTVAR
jgi:hypothetical protein